MASTDGSGDMDTAEVPLDFEEDLVKASSSSPDSKFDEIIGHIEEIIMEDEFQQLQQDFMDKYYLEFDTETEENKFSYTEIHKEYIDLIEKYLLTELSDRIEDFEIEDFQKELIQRKEELVGEVFEMLLTFSDFVSFKEMFIDYRNQKEGNCIDLSEGIVVHSLTTATTPSIGVTPQALPPSSSKIPSQQPSLHNLEVGGQSFMISTPGAPAVDIDFGVNAVQINRAAPNGHSSGDLNTNSVVSNGDMHFSSRPEQMDQ